MRFKVRVDVFAPIYGTWILAHYSQTSLIYFHWLVNVNRHNSECLGTPRTSHPNHHLDPPLRRFFENITFLTNRPNFLEKQ